MDLNRGVDTLIKVVPTKVRGCAKEQKLDPELTTISYGTLKGECNWSAYDMNRIILVLIIT